jgi:hypothetical protein
MKFSLIKNMVGALAPTLGSALGGPLGGQAASVIAGVLGCKSDPKSINQAGLLELWALLLLVGLWVIYF